MVQSGAWFRTDGSKGLEIVTIAAETCLLYTEAYAVYLAARSMYGTGLIRQIAKKLTNT